MTIIKFIILSNLLLSLSFILLKSLMFIHPIVKVTALKIINKQPNIGNFSGILIILITANKDNTVAISPKIPIILINLLMSLM